MKRFYIGFAMIIPVFSGVTHAQEVEYWKVGRTMITTQVMPDTGWVISQPCFTEAFAEQECLSISYAKKASLKKLTREMRSGGKNPGSVLCKTFPNSRVFIAVDLKGNQNSFCLFEDRSFISNGSLMKAAIKNDSNE